MAGRNPAPSSVARLDLELAHRWSRGRGVTVAVIDTGVDRDHPGLAGRLASELDFVGARDDPEVASRHGTAVAGVIAASTHAQLGVLGVAPEARLAILKACWQTSPSDASCNSFTLAQAIAAAVEIEAGVINLSLTGPPDPLLERLLGAAMARNQVVIGALPPGPAPHGPRHFPTSVAGVIRVQMAEIEGAGNPGALLAPGEEVLTLQPGARYGRASGSSLAAAHVSGIVALLLERDRQLDPANVHALLATHSRPLELKDHRRVFIVSACDSVASLVDGHCTRPADSAGGFAAPPPTSAPSTSYHPSQ
jgi:subtilisin family serine protease